MQMAHSQMISDDLDAEPSHILIHAWNLRLSRLFCCPSDQSVLQNHVSMLTAIYLN